MDEILSALRELRAALLAYDGDGTDEEAFDLNHLDAELEGFLLKYRDRVPVGAAADLDIRDHHGLGPGRVRTHDGEYPQQADEM